jgi:peptidoglycan hydrolase CwlO-like protein
MTVERFEEIKDKIESLKEKKNKAQGVIDSILKELKETYGFKSDNPIAEAEAEVKKLKTEIEEAEERIESIGNKIESLADWDSIDD